MTRTVKIAAAAVAIAAAGAIAWRYVLPNDERDVRRRLDALAAEFNQSTTDGLGTVARAARIGSFFTEDVVVELGQGSPPIHGRETLIGMSTRLQPRTAAFVLEFSDVTVDLLDAAHAEVTFTLVIRRRSESGAESLDAREFAVDMRKAGGDWRVSRAIAIDTLR